MVISIEDILFFKQFTLKLHLVVLLFKRTFGFIMGKGVTRGSVTRIQAI